MNPGEHAEVPHLRDFLGLATDLALLQRNLWYSWTSTHDEPRATFGHPGFFSTPNHIFSPHKGMETHLLS